MERFLEAISQVLVPPFQVVQQVVNYEWIFPVAHCPSEIESNEEPPIRLGERVDMIPIDGVLGLYSPATQQVTIFRKGVLRVAEILSVREHDLTFVVRIHEWNHALVHVGLLEADRLRVTREDSLWESCLVDATSRFQEIEGELHERLAQLLTFHGLQTMQEAATAPDAKAVLERIANTFMKLTRRASAEYQIDNYTGVPKHRIVKSIRLLKNRSLVGLSAWDTVVRW
jgi:predicted transcriptional regulator